MTTMQQMQENLSRYRELFTMVRLIDANSITVLPPDPDNPNAPLCRCIDTDGNRYGCRTCLSPSVLETHSTKIKLETIHSDTYLITAQYREIDGRPYVLELRQRLNHNMLVLSNSSEELFNQMSFFHEKLYHDALTGVCNRRYYEEKIRGQSISAGVAMLDVDDFKLYNDTFGHYAGDMALKTVVQAILSNLHGADKLIRSGGDEFLLILPHATEGTLHTRLQKICEQIHTAIVPGYSHMQLSVSIGGAVINGTFSTEFIDKIDRLMYQAKTRKNTVVTEYQLSRDMQQATGALPAKAKILIVDDSEMNRAILSEILQNDYEILEASNGQEGLNVLRKHGVSISLVLLDMVMPIMNGFEFLSAMANANLMDDIPVIMISSEGSDTFIRQAYELGVSDYINRPFDAKVVYRRVLNTITLYAKQRHLVSLITNQIYEKERNNHIMVTILSHIVEFRNGESGTHVMHMRLLTERILECLVQKTDKYKLTAADLDLIATASALHDIGKIAIDDKILNNPDKLTKEEFDIMKTHTTQGASILQDLKSYQDEPLVRTAYQICRWHHERYDGRGYPDGLKGDEIPIGAQVVALADVYDALVSERAYKKAFPHEEAIHMILNGECGVFNPILLECLKEISHDLPNLTKQVNEQL